MAAVLLGLVTIGNGIPLGVTRTATRQVTPPANDLIVDGFLDLVASPEPSNEGIPSDALDALLEASPSADTFLVDPLESEEARAEDMDFRLPEESMVPEVSPVKDIDTELLIGSPEASSDSLSVDNQLAEATAEATDDSEDTCFPSSATVQLEDGRVKRMSEIELGDRVMVGDNEFSDVFMFTHKMADVTNKFVQINTESGNKLELTGGHFLYVNNKLVPADSVRAGDRVFLANGSASRVASVDCTRLGGLYNPQTVQGDIIVNGIRTSTYTKTVQPTTAHAILAPLRIAYEKLGLSTSVLEFGASRMALLLPQAIRSN